MQITRVSQKFCNILVAWGTIQQLWMLLLSSWKCWTTLDCEIPNSSDTFQGLFMEFALMAWRTALESMILGLSDLAWSSGFLQPEQNFLNHLLNVLLSTAFSPFAQ